jgi:hypothetical protein
LGTVLYFFVLKSEVFALFFVFLEGGAVAIGGATIATAVTTATLVL